MIFIQEHPYIFLAGVLFIIIIILALCDRIYIYRLRQRILEENRLILQNQEQREINYSSIP